MADKPNSPVSADEARRVAEEARESEWKAPSFLKQIFLGSLRLDLIHEGVGPLYGHVGAAGDGNDFARAHYEQHMRVHGTLQTDDEKQIELNGHGLRDHSWGPRYWQSTPSYRWTSRCC